MGRERKSYTVHKYPAYKLSQFNGLEVIEEKYFNTLPEISTYLDVVHPLVHKAMYCTMLNKKTNVPYKIERNLKKYKLTVEGEEPEYFLTIKEISELLGEYFGLVKGRVIRIDNC
jgi:hypothetical protein